jgi:acyl-CoA synthetase (AMP-forming)/AMP-acid ligase II
MAPYGRYGYVDADGYFFITGRKKDIIIKGGENISPAGRLKKCSTPIRRLPKPP